MNEVLSITIVAYKNYDDIEKAITSIERYTSETIKKSIFIVDNSDTKNNKELIRFKKFIKFYQDVYYISAGGNKGFGVANNLIIDKIDSKYHAIVNPDILFCEDSFSKIISYMDSNQEIGMVIPLLVNEYGERQDVYRRELTILDMFNRMFLGGKLKKRSEYHSMNNMDYSKPFEVPFGQGSFLVIRTNLFKKLKGFDENYFMYVEDADLCKRVNQISKLVYYPRTKVIHKWEKGSHKSKLLFKYHLKSTFYYFKKWGIKLF